MDHNAEQEHQVYCGDILDQEEMDAENNNSKDLEDIEEEAEMQAKVEKEMGLVQGSKHMKKNHKQILEPKEVAVPEDEVAPPQPEKTGPQSDWPPWAVDFAAQFIAHIDRPFDNFQSYMDYKFADMHIWMVEHLTQALVLEPDDVTVTLPYDVEYVDYKPEDEVAPPQPQKTGLRSKWPRWARMLDDQVTGPMTRRFAESQNDMDDKFADIRVRMVKCLREVVLKPKAVAVVPPDDEDTDEEDYYMSEDEGAAPQPQQIGPKSKRPQWEDDLGVLVTGHVNRRFADQHSHMVNGFADMYKCFTQVVIQKLTRSRL